MLRQNPNNPCQLQEFQNNLWVTIFDTSICASSTTTLVGSNNLCNLATELVDVALLNGVTDILTRASLLSTVLGIAGVIGSVGVTVTGLGVPLGIAFLATNGVGSTASFIVGAGAAVIQNELDAGYWEAVRKQIYCTLREGDQLTPEVLNDLAISVLQNINIPGKENANQMVARALWNLSREAAVAVYTAAAYNDSTQNDCDDCNDRFTPIVNSPNSELVSLGGNRYRLRVTVGSILFGYRGSIRFPYRTYPARITIESTNPDPILPFEANGIIGSYAICSQRGVIYQAVGPRLNYLQIMYIIDINDIVFNLLNFFSNSAFDVTFIVQLDDALQSTSTLFIGNNRFFQVPYSPQNDGSFLFNSEEYPNLTDVDGFQHFRFGSSTSCGRLNLSTMEANILPVRIRIYPCDDTNQYNEYSQPANSAEINDFFQGNTCFNSFAIAPNPIYDFFLFRANILPCLENWCYTFDFTQSAGGWVTHNNQSALGASG